MYNTTYQKWLDLHNNSGYLNKLPNTLLDSWKKSYKLGIDAHNSLPLICTDENFKKKKENSKTLYYYANDVLKKVFLCSSNYNFAVALFDSNACATKIYGNELFIKWAKENHLQKKSIWSEDIIGTNAVSLGLKHKKPISVIGEEHFSKFAINMAMYFSPIIVEKDTNDMINCGGIAVVTPTENKNPNFLFTANTITRSIALHFFWFESVSLFTNSVDGYVVLDQSNNRNKIIFISKQIFNFLDLPFKDMYYRNLEEIIDPYPKNKYFWDAINGKIRMEDTDMNLNVAGKEIQINLSIRPFYGRNFHVQGVSLIFNSRERIHNLISKHTGTTAPFTFSQIIGESKKYLNIISQAKATSQNNANVLLLGESGVGKDIIAQSIHNASDRKDKSFIAVNCAAFPKDLISSELFGYEEGAFTGAKKGGQIGKFELANHGTIFLDEIGDMPLDLQAILLRVIEQKNFMKIGSNVPINLDIRIIAATNKNLKEAVKKGEFREDLYYRLGVIRLNIPPLRDRKEDIIPLAENFIEKICKRVNKPIVTLSPEVKNSFINYHWPGNVRELQNILEGVIQIYDTPVIKYEHISNYINEENSITQKKDINTHYKERFIRNKNINNREYLINALNLNKYNKTKAAKYLGISRNTLYAKLKKYNIPY